MEAIFAGFKSPGPQILEFGPFILRWYGLLIALSVLIGLNLSNNLAKKRDLPPGTINDLLPILILSSLIGARIYYVIFEWRYYSGINFWSNIKFLGFKLQIPTAIEIWGGGIAIHGALIGGTISVIIFCKLRKILFWNVLDVLLPSVALGQAIGRGGNFFNNEAFGVPTSLPWKLFIPYNYRPPFFSDQSFFHPTFLYESIWNIGIFCLLIYLFQLGIKRLIRLPPGALSFVYLIMYSLGRLWIEGLRIDPLCINGLPPFCQGGIRVAQLISILLIGTGFWGLLWVSRKNKNGTLKSINNNQRF